jgi:hypothetical protein
MAEPDAFSGSGEYDLRPEKLAENPVTVVDDWPANVPVTAAEVETIERYLGPSLAAFLRGSG